MISPYLNGEPDSPRSTPAHKVRGVCRGFIYCTRQQEAIATVDRSIDRQRASSDDAIANNGQQLATTSCLQQPTTRPDNQQTIRPSSLYQSPNPAATTGSVRVRDGDAATRRTLLMIDKRLDT
jgi:hypothetical protein